MPSLEDIQRLIIVHQRRLQKLKEQRATYGISAAPEILIEIEDIEIEIQRLQTELTEDITITHPEIRVPHLAPNLPPHFIDRTEIIRCKEKLLASQLISSCLVLSGMGGIGKTTLAIALANEEEIKEHFKDGVLWATLGPDSAVENWQLTWGIALGEDLRMFPTSATKATRLRDLLAYKTCLIVIDDVTPNIDLTDLLVGGRTCRTVITTREKTIAEQIGGTVFEVGALNQAKSLALLSEWAGHDLSNDATAAQLVQLTGYLPLAIRLVGAKLMIGKKLADILRAFKSQRPFSITDSQNALGKQYSLRLSFRISLEYLDKDDRLRFIQLAAFAKNEPFDAVAVGAIWKKLNKVQAVTEHLDTLVYHALIMRLETSTTSNPQYLLHPLLHFYAEELLKKAGWEGKVYEYHTRYYLQIAKHSVEEWELTERVFGQIREAFKRVRNRVRNTESDKQLFEFIDNLSTFFERRGLWSDYIEWAEAGLNLARRLGDREIEGRMLRHVGYGYYLLGDLDKALTHNKLSLQICWQLGNQTGILKSLVYLGQIYRDLKDIEAAQYCYKRSLVIARKLVLKTDIADCLGSLGHIYQIHGDFQLALTYCRQALAINQELGNRSGLAREYNNIGLILDNQGCHDQALENYKQALILARKLGNKVGLAFAFTNIGTSYFKQRRYTKAEKLLAAAVNLLKDLGHTSQVEEAQRLLNIARMSIG